MQSASPHAGECEAGEMKDKIMYRIACRIKIDLLILRVADLTNHGLLIFPSWKQDFCYSAFVAMVCSRQDLANLADIRKCGFHDLYRSVAYFDSGIRKRFSRLQLWNCFVGLLSAATPAAAAQTEPLVFLSTQLRPVQEAQRLRDAILPGFPRSVDYVTAPPWELTKRIEASRRGETRPINVVGALHGELLSLAEQDELAPLDDAGARLKRAGIPDPLLLLGRFGTSHQFYIPWMQAGYVMVANKKALPYLPAGANIDALSYDQLAAWSAALRDKIGQRLLGFPAGPRGLIDRFFEGFLYPSYTGGVLVPFRSPAAEAMWRQFASLWQSVNPASATYDSMQHPLLSGDVWLAFDHVARLLPALRAKPDEFITFPAPAGPRGRGYMPVLVGLAVVKGAPDMDGAMALIDYLRRPETQIGTARSVGFFPAVKEASLEELEPALRMGAATLDKMRSAKDALLALPPAGLGERDSEFDKGFTDTFEQIVLRGEAPRAVLDRQAETLRRLIAQVGVHCWRPDPPSTGACQVQ
jgi:multiple sugar transport system substrate-binding protein